LGQLRDSVIGRRELLGFRGGEGEFETTTVVSQGCKSIIRREDESATNWFVGYGIYDYPADMISGVGAGTLGLGVRKGARQECES
jgi:hypothetical protein